MSVSQHLLYYFLGEMAQNEVWMVWVKHMQAIHHDLIPRYRAIPVHI